ncbi:MAG: endolytic transglycosylase MltG, partial [Proteobacteria bacterium]|nr:endolytic transglycosylase MltG [Pseudomonadota bacterium]
MAKIVRWLVVLVFFAGLGAAWGYCEYMRFTHAPLNLGASERVFQIAPGSSARSIARSLASAKIIEHEWMMRLVFARSGLENRLQPGAVVLTPDLTPADLPDAIARVGRFARKSVQILPGMNLYEIAARLQSLRIADEKTFVSMATDPVRVAQAGIPAASFEGYLAPGAYTFDVGTSTDDIIAQMHGRWRDQWLKIVAEYRGAHEAAHARNLTDHSLVTLASMVEKEALVDAERPVIARIFYNRIRKKMKLQSDPTCVYPPLTPGEKPSPERCRDPQNAYSTYVQPALPPGPISMPSAASLRAVLAPYSGPDDTQLLYFVARNDGTWRHYFSKSYAEHQVA